MYEEYDGLDFLLDHFAALRERFLREFEEPAEETRGFRAAMKRQMARNAAAAERSRVFRAVCSGGVR